MSDNKKPDWGHSASTGESNGNRGRLIDQDSLEEIMSSLPWLIFVVAAAGFLAFQLMVDAFYEEQYERDVAWISRQSRKMTRIEEEDEDSDEYTDDDDDDDDDDDFLDDDDFDEENQMEAAAEGRAEVAMCTGEDAGATCLIDLATCTCVPDRAVKENEIKCKLYYFFDKPTFLVAIPLESEGEDSAEEEENEEEENETGELEEESENSMDFAEGPLP